MMRLSSLLRTRVALTPYAQPRPFARHAAAAFSSQAHLSGTRFSSLEITENSKRAIRQELKYEFLTDVQEKTFAHIVQGKDILSKAKTGNGKTMAFLLPAIERIVRHGLNNTPNSIPMLVISPTRELAQQIAVEARKIGQFHDLHVACFVGGTSVHKDAQTLKGAKPVDILVATPGRLLDHIDQDSGHIRKLLRKLQFLVLDEADRLLDMGFRNEVVKILNSVPAQRQTLLFSATLPKSTQELTKLALRKDFELVDTVSDGEEQTNVQVQQEYVVCRATEVVATVENVLAAHIAQFPSNYKVIAFFPTARAAQFMAQLFSAAGFKGVLEIHSRKSQVARTKTAAKFRESSRVMLFSSDVSARGVDYPDVTLVLQVGLTDRDSYIHRLGRTARGGSQGRGVLVLADFEKTFLNDLKGLPLGKYAKNEAVTESRTAKTMATLAQNPELAKSAMQSYQAWLGFYHSNLRRLGINKEELVQMAEVYSQTIGLQEVPRLDTKILRKMGMFGIAGLVPADEKERRPRSASGPTRNNSKQVSSSPRKSDRENADDDSGESNWNDRGRSQSRERSEDRDERGRSQSCERSDEWNDRGRSQSRERSEDRDERGRSQSRERSDEWNDRGRSQSRERSEDRKGRGRSQPRERSDEWNNRGRSQSREPSEDWNDRGRSATRGEWSDRKRRSSSFPRTARRTDSRGPSRGGRR